MSRVVLVLCVPVLFVALACSDFEGDPGAVARAAEKSRAQGTVVFEGVESGGWERTDDSTLSGVLDFEQGRTLFEAEQDGEEYALIIDGDEVYVSAPELKGAWFMYEDDPAEFGLGDPRAIFTSLTRVSAANYGGTEKVEGEKLNRYSFTLRTDRAIAAWGRSEEDAEGFEDESRGTAWIDGDGLIRQLRFELPRIDKDNSDEPCYFVVAYDDYGTADPVELPDEDEVMSYVDLLGDLEGAAAVAAFPDANCWGHQVVDCLDPNPEVAAMAQDPELCRGDVARVCLAPVGYVRADIVQAIVDFHRDTKGIEIVVLPSLPVWDEMVDSDSFQVTEYDIYEYIKAQYGVVEENASTFIGLTPFDMKPRDDGFGWFFGARFNRYSYGQQDGVFSTFRMENVEPYSGEPITDEPIQERAAKYFARYVALLHLKYAAEEDIRYVNYFEMYGFSDLDSMGMEWPLEDPPCAAGTEPIVCITPDMQWDNPEFMDDLALASERLSSMLGIPVEIWKSSGFYPTKEDWAEEMEADTRFVAGSVLQRGNVYVISVTDDAFAQAPSVAPSIDRVWPGERLALVSGFDAGTPGTPEHQERLYRLLLRAALRTYGGQALNADPTSLLFEGAVTPADLDAAVLP